MLLHISMSRKSTTTFGFTYRKSLNRSPPQIDACLIWSMIHAKIKRRARTSGCTLRLVERRGNKSSGCIFRLVQRRGAKSVGAHFFS